MPAARPPTRRPPTAAPGLPKPATTYVAAPAAAEERSESAATVDLYEEATEQGDPGEEEAEAAEAAERSGERRLSAKQLKQLKQREYYKKRNEAKKLEKAERRRAAAEEHGGSVADHPEELPKPLDDDADDAAAYDEPAQQTPPEMRFAPPANEPGRTQSALTLEVAHDEAGEALPAVFVASQPHSPHLGSAHLASHGHVPPQPISPHLAANGWGGYDAPQPLAVAAAWAHDSLPAAGGMWAPRPELLAPPPHPPQPPPERRALANSFHPRVGYPNGYPNGYANGHADGYANGDANGDAYGHIVSGYAANAHAHGNAYVNDQTNGHAYGNAYDHTIGNAYANGCGAVPSSLPAMADGIGALAMPPMPTLPPMPPMPLASLDAHGATFASGGAAAVAVAGDGGVAGSRTCYWRHEGAPTLLCLAGSPPPFTIFENARSVKMVFSIFNMRVCNCPTPWGCLPLAAISSPPTGPDSLGVPLSGPEDHRAPKSSGAGGAR